MKLEEILKKAVDIPIKVDDSLELPLGIIEDTEDGMGICTMDWNKRRDRATAEELATAHLLVHCYNKFEGLVKFLEAALDFVDDGEAIDFLVNNGPDVLDDVMEVKGI